MGTVSLSTKPQTVQVVASAINSPTKAVASGHASVSVVKKVVPSSVSPPNAASSGLAGSQLDLQALQKQGMILVRLPNNELGVIKDPRPINNHNKQALTTAPPRPPRPTATPKLVGVANPIVTRARPPPQVRHALRHLTGFSGQGQTRASASAILQSSSSSAPVATVSQAPTAVLLANTSQPQQQQQPRFVVLNVNGTHVLQQVPAASPAADQLQLVQLPSAATVLNRAAVASVQSQVPTQPVALAVVGGGTNLAANVQLVRQPFQQPTLNAMQPVMLQASNLQSAPVQLVQGNQPMLLQQGGQLTLLQNAMQLQGVQPALGARVENSRPVINLNNVFS